MSSCWDEFSGCQLSVDELMWSPRFKAWVYLNTIVEFFSSVKFSQKTSERKNSISCDFSRVWSEDGSGENDDGKNKKLGPLKHFFEDEKINRNRYDAKTRWESDVDNRDVDVAVVVGGGGDDDDAAAKKIKNCQFSRRTSGRWKIGRTYATFFGQKF